MKQLTFLPFLFLSLIWIGCREEIPQTFSERVPTLPEVPYVYAEAEFPEHFTEVSSFRRSLNRFVNDSAVELGRVLFYDKQLSLNNTVSCGSCHKQAFGFADPIASSVGFKGATTPRNSMSIVNPALNNNFFWDSRVQTAEQLAIEPVLNHIEMGMESMEDLEHKLAASSFYPELFEGVYGSPEITETRIAEAIAHFLKSIVSTDTKFDRGHENDFADFTPLELEGKKLFFGEKGNCSFCHSGGNLDAPDSFQEYYGIVTTGGAINNLRGTANIGLDLNYEDNGLNEGQFKIPSLRNIALTGPYMHDGRFERLEEVINHYSHGIQAHKNLDPKFMGNEGEVLRMKFSPLEVQSLIAFLHTLTDETMLTDPKYSDPFLD
ncbi:MAG: cytochrome c peroxidase [Bacteroidota bacterium]